MYMCMSTRNSLPCFLRIWSWNLSCCAHLVHSLLPKSWKFEATGAYPCRNQRLLHPNLETRCRSVCSFKTQSYIQITLKARKGNMNGNVCCTVHGPSPHVCDSLLELSSPHLHGLVLVVSHFCSCGIGDLTIHLYLFLLINEAGVDEWMGFCTSYKTWAGAIVSFTAATQSFYHVPVLKFLVMFLNCKLRNTET